MKTKAEIATETFSNGYHCAQSVLVAFCEDYGLEIEMAKKVAGAFGGGMGHIGEVCGAVTGGLMVIGLKHGKYKDDMPLPAEKTYKIVKEYIDKFKMEFGSINCTELLKYDLSKENELIEARKSGIFKTLCPLLVKRSTEIIEEII